MDRSNQELAYPQAYNAFVRLREMLTPYIRNGLDNTKRQMYNLLSTPTADYYPNPSNTAQQYMDMLSPEERARLYARANNLY